MNTDQHGPIHPDDWRRHDELEHWADQFVGDANRLQRVIKLTIFVVAIVLVCLLLSAWAA